MNSEAWAVLAAGLTFSREPPSSSQKAYVVVDRVVEYYALLGDVPDTLSKPALVDTAVRDASNSKSLLMSDGVSQ